MLTQGNCPGNGKFPRKKTLMQWVRGGKSTREPPFPKDAGTRRKTVSALTSSVEVQLVECTWSWSNKYERHLTRVTKFDEAQCNNKAHMYKVLSRRSTYDFGRTNTWSCKAMEVFLLIKFPRHISIESKDSSIKPYLTGQQLNNYEFPKIWYTSSSLAKNKKYASEKHKTRG